MITDLSRAEEHLIKSEAGIGHISEGLEIARAFAYIAIALVNEIMVNNKYHRDAQTYSSYFTGGKEE